MRTLFVTPGPPLPADRGARVRDHALISRVSARHPTSLLALLGSGESAGPLEPMRESLEALETVGVEERPRVPIRPRAGAPRVPLGCAPFLNARAAGALASLARRVRPDVIQLEHWFLAPLVDALHPGERPAMAISLHNIASAQYRSMASAGCPAASLGYRLKSRLARRVERGYVRRFDAVICVSEPDRKALQELVPGVHPEVVPNGVDCGALRPLPEGGGPPTALFVGNLDYRPNLDAARWLCERVLPMLRRTHPDIEIRLVGSGGGRGAASLGRSPGVTRVGPVEDVASEYRGATVVVAPLLAGGGTRLKVLEGMALGRPVVSTTPGAEGLGLVPGEHLLVADEPSEFAAAVARLLDKPERRHKLAAAARARVDSEHCWDRSAETLLGVHQRAVEGRRGQEVGR